MPPFPDFENVAIVGDRAAPLAEIASWFRRDRRYLPMLDGPRMARQDWTNEVFRRSSALGLIHPKRVILFDLSDGAARHLTEGENPAVFVRVTSVAETEVALRGWVRPPPRVLHWGRSNLGIGLMLARRAGQALRVDELLPSPEHDTFIPGGRHLLIACEDGDELAQVIASNLAYAMGAAFLVFPRLADAERKEWQEALYTVGSDGADATREMLEIRERSRARLAEVPYSRYTEIAFVTHGFPWGVAVPERPTTHLYSHPDFGRCLIEGLWASADNARSARTALLVEPGQVDGSEMGDISRSLGRNNTLVRPLEGRAANVNTVDVLVQTLPFDIIVFSTHAGDSSGTRVTYAYTDSEGIARRLVVDHAVGFGYDPVADQFRVEQHERYYELDGVLWSDEVAKAAMYVGAAIISWMALGNIIERNKYKVAEEPIPRVAGSMGMKMGDNVWFAAMHGMAPGCFPIVVCNACSSWHELSLRFIYAGARAYIGALFPVLGVEAQEIARQLFGAQLGTPLPLALWNAQNAVYGSRGRHPYVVFGLPICAIRPNQVNSVRFMRHAYRSAIASYQAKYVENNREGGYPDVRENALRYSEYLQFDFEGFVAQFGDR